MFGSKKSASPPRAVTTRSDGNLVVEKANVPAVRAGQELAPVSAKFNAGSAVPVTFSSSGTTDFSVAYESFVSGFVSRRYENALAPSFSSPPPTSEPAQQSKTDPEPNAIVALDEPGNLAVVLGRALHATADAHQRFFQSGGGRTIHPSGFEIVGARTLKIPRSIMRELVNRPTDPRELYVLAAAISSTNPLSSEPPEIRLTWACGETPEAAVKRWQEAEKGLRGLAREGKRAAIITSLLIPRSQMDWTLRFPPVKDD